MNSAMILLLGVLNLSIAKPDVRLTVDPSSLPAKWSLEDSTPLALPGHSPRTLMYAETINDTPIADVSVRTFHPPMDKLHADAREWLRAMFSFKDVATKTDWLGVEAARFVERDGRKWLRAELTVPSRATFGPRKDHMIAIWAAELEGNILVLSYDRTVSTYRFGIKAVEELFDQVRPMVRPNAR